VEAVCDLYGCWRALARAFGVRSAAVTADDLDAWVSVQPRRERRRLAVGQQLDGSAAFEINEDGAVALPLALGPVVDAEHRGCRALGPRRAPDARQESVCASRHAEPCGGARSGLTAEGESEQRQRLVEAAGAARVRGDDLRQPLGENAPRAVEADAEELARVKFEPGDHAVPGQVGDPAAVAAVDSPGHRAAARASGARGGRVHDQRQRCGGRNNALKAQAGRVGEQCGGVHAACCSS
jgi:hypothetical protein